MKTLRPLSLAWCILRFAGPVPAADDLTTQLQRALFEEQANRDLPAAIQAYQALLAEHDAQRKLAATALFRLGECYRKLGRTNDATLHYQRLLRDFADQTELVDQSRRSLTDLGGAPQLPSTDFEAAVARTGEETIIRQIQALIQDSPDLINARLLTGQTRLHDAAENGQLAVAKFLLANKADVNAPASSTRDTPLHLAVESGQKAMVELLLESGADVNARTSTGATPLHDAAALGFRVIAELLLTGKADVNAGTADGQTPLHLAAREGFGSVAEILLERGANIEARDKTRTTPLLLAVSQGQLALVDLLLQRGASVQAADDRGRQALHRVFEALANRPELMELLLSRNADVNAQDKNNNTLLHLAVANKADDLARLILSHKPDLERVDREGFTPLQRAATGATPGMVKLLLEAGARPNVIDKTGMSPLHYAAGVLDLERAELLLAHRADPNLTDNNGDSPLSLARRVMTQGNPQGREMASQVVQLLLKHGADENLHRRGLIMIRRKDWTQPFFYRGTNAHNQYTLADLVGLIYLTDRQTREPLSFPALDNVIIHHLLGPTAPPGGGGNLVDYLEKGECFGHPLVWGDVVEIPEADHKINEVWKGLPAEHQSTLKNCLQRKVRLTAGGETKELTLLLPAFRGPGVLSPPPPPPVAPGSVQVGFRLNAVLRASNMLRTSSDLSRVKVVRADPQTGRSQEIFFDLSDQKTYDERTDLWLRDGDLIEVP
jgi:ankyrin repeat protein